MVEAAVGETFGVVDLLVQTDDGGHVVFPEVREVSLGGVERVTCGVLELTSDLLIYCLIFNAELRLCMESETIHAPIQ